MDFFGKFGEGEVDSVPIGYYGKCSPKFIVINGLGLSLWVRAAAFM
jgi:hypothetical protein